jgi:hypothetical protein
MNINDARKIGYEIGRNIASYTDVREVESVDPEGNEILSEEDQREWFVKDSLDVEMAARDYTPFEYTAKVFNNAEYPDEIWDNYEKGVLEGIKFVLWLEFDNRQPY